MLLVNVEGLGFGYLEAGLTRNEIWAFDYIAFWHLTEDHDLSRGLADGALADRIKTGRQKAQALQMAQVTRQSSSTPR